MEQYQGKENTYIRTRGTQTHSSLGIGSRRSNEASLWIKETLVWRCEASQSLRGHRISKGIKWKIKPSRMWETQPKECTPGYIGSGKRTIRSEQHREALTWLRGTILLQAKRSGTQTSWETKGNHHTTSCAAQPQVMIKHVTLQVGCLPYSSGYQ